MVGALTRCQKYLFRTPYGVQCAELNVLDDIERNKKSTVVVIFLFILPIILGVIFNALLLTVLFSQRNSRTNRTNTFKFLISVCVSDMLLAPIVGGQQVRIVADLLF